jgi:putative ABC transport system substrate-binding protein
MQRAGIVAVALLAGCGRLPWQAEPSARVPRIGLLLSLSAGPSAITDAFFGGLHDQGYRPDQNVAIERRYSEGRDDRLPTLATELVALPVDLIVTSGPPATHAARNATRELPIVMVAGDPDPVATGLAASLARPGGNVTGLAVAPPELISQKQLELLKETVPGLARVGVLWDINLGPFPQALYEGTGRVLGVQLVPLEVRSPEELEDAFDTATRRRVEGLWNVGSPMFYVYRERIAALASQSRLPSISLFREAAEAGELMAYGSHLPAMARRAAVYVDKILKGAKPADLPVEQPMTFEFVINLTTAQQLVGQLP